MQPLISKNREPIATLCRRHGVERLEVFGSVLRDDFNESSSDVDLVVEFEPIPTASPFDQYMGFKADLEVLFHRPVDLIQLRSMPDTRLKRHIERAKVPLYAASA
ncbi:MAG: nucleotidyltransferase domain-containing protein [Pseudomonadota bacterium]